LAIEHIRLQQNFILEQAEAQRLDELNRLKSFFVSSVSHELQTPLASIRMFAELLRTKKKISEKENFFQEKSGRRR
jgi:signal transduction histidine kinase